MNELRYRRHPRVYKKAHDEDNSNTESSISISALTAVGVLAAIFVKGVFWGYILRKSMRH